MMAAQPIADSSTAATATNDLGLLISILYSAESAVWRNVERSVHRLRPRWCSLAVDTWSRPQNVSTADVRVALYAQQARVLSGGDWIVASEVSLLAPPDSWSVAYSTAATRSPNST